MGLGERARAEADLRTEVVEGGGARDEMEGVEAEVANRGEVARLVGVEAREERRTGCEGDLALIE